MEDWKAAQKIGEEEVIYSEKPSVYAFVDETEESKSTQRQSISHPPRLSDFGRDDWDEQNSTLRNSKEMAHTLMEKECAAEDVIRVWEDISKIIIFKMMEGQGVRIAGLGTFTFRIHKTPINHKSVRVTKTPVFIISKHVAQMYQLKQDQLMASNVAVVPLNLSVIANEAKIPRGMIEGIVTEVLQAFARAVVCNKSLEFPFPFIGKIQIRDQKVTMKFYDEFCKKMGFNIAESTKEGIAYENMIPGRMTPLKLHIPSETFRSVFHLREVRSVHENSLVVPLTSVKGKYLPITVACVEKSDCSKSKDGLKIDKVSETKQEKPCSFIKSKPQYEISAEKKLKSKDYYLKGFKPQPLYKAQKTGDCILDKMIKCPEVMQQMLRTHMYQVLVRTLGQSEVKSHFHRRGKYETFPTFTQKELECSDFNRCDRC